MDSGFKFLASFIDRENLNKINLILRRFHEAWLIKNENFYQKGAINSAYITNGEFLSSKDRLELLKFIGSKQIVTEARNFLGEDILFLNSQIFFNPSNSLQKNYWHRDIQYTGQAEQEQRKTIEAKQCQVVHLRIAFADENGIELIPESHFRWDFPEELNIRLKQNGKNVSDEIANSKKIPLKQGDLLAFDANIIHRGLYGKDRFAFDILFCKPQPELTRFIAKEVLPKTEELKHLECPEVFEST